jgi:hypothetical protein
MMDENKNTHRFSGNQTASDMMLLLHNVSITCLSHMHTLLLGTNYKHGDLFKPTNDGKETRVALLDAMMDLAQELDISQEDIVASWERVKQQRQEGHQWGKEWVEKYGD